MKNVLSISDLHAPFQHPDALKFLDWVAHRYKTEIVTCTGDEVDMHAMSDYDSDPDGLTAGLELEAALYSLKPLYKLFPDVKVCTSNHTSRPYRKAFKHGIARAYLRDYRDFLQAPQGWVWADSWEIDGVLYEHGEAFSGANAAFRHAMGRMRSVVIGHTHTQGGIQWYSSGIQSIFGLNSGCLIDPAAYAFKYAKNAAAKPVLGCGVILKGIPQFIPLLTDSKGRWIKR